MADGAQALIRHDGAGLALITERGVSRVTLILDNGRVLLAASQAGGGCADVVLEPVDARHLAERLTLAAAEVEAAAEDAA
ncbi:hypothetical protein [Methylobacterium isbiliense]|uniref:Uncharacterized protein n=1 Tax=Methylobacterium isbiliense TaxID=315478 RepID=A0ABQ4SFP2_9HYPH|nr:hypothetical protein [Methylobacterium isbiliense]MDN3622573.1 hypothetical protein [Methylobacterium isbiliense]GJE00579.1 hypothetical protein GMJLKIPL_2502 [Methylobacterium isbiliense]